MARLRLSIGRDIDHLEIAPQGALMAARSAVFLPSELPDPITQLVEPERDASSIATRPLDDLAPRPRFGVYGFAAPVVHAALNEAADDRRFHPDIKARRVSGKAASIEATPRARSFSSAPISFKQAMAVIPCIRRKARRAAIFGTGKAGGHHRKPRKGRYSDVRC